ncbi:MAG: PTS sugar transporter subunit IIB [Desulfovibrionaceae bacterium]|nr:PTS sugar transporter subunit IIB [Desulfovibrionaceae bacterium]
MIWYRIDERLVHGQIIEAWLPYLKTFCLVIANDDLVGDEIRRQIMLLGVPSRLRTEFLPLDRLSSFIAAMGDLRQNMLVLFSACLDVRRAYELGAPIAVCNVGNLHHREGKRRLCPHVSLSAEEEGCLRFLQQRGVSLDFRGVPADNPVLKYW